MKPIYEARAWRDDDWWLVRVVGASDDADLAPLNALTQARTLAQVEPMARDLVATILDAEEGTFDITVNFDLSDDVGELVHQARASRAWVEAAKELWQDRSTAAARALAEKGYSLRETAALLGLSHQRVDQLLNAPESVMERAFADSLASNLAGTGAASLRGADVIFVLSRPAGSEGGRPYLAEMDPQFKDEAIAAVLAWRARLAGHAPGKEAPDQGAPEGRSPAQPATDVIGQGWAVVQI
jgi:hypothetical protein